MLVLTKTDDQDREYEVEVTLQEVADNHMTDGVPHDDVVCLENFVKNDVGGVYKTPTAHYDHHGIAELLSHYFTEAV